MNNKSSTYKKIIHYFNQASRERVKVMAADPLLNYEQRVRQETIIKLLKPKRGETILDLGCGEGQDVKIILPYGVNYIGLDISLGMIEKAKEQFGSKNKIKFLVGNANKLPFKDETFEKILCSEVIEHIPDYKKALNEIGRVLKKEGTLVLSTPNQNSLYGLQRVLLDFIYKAHYHKGRRENHPWDKWKRIKELKQALKENSFSIKEIITVCYLPGELSYRLPLGIKRFLLLLIKPVERFMQTFIRRGGYIICIKAKK